MNIPDLLSGVFTQHDIWGTNFYIRDTFQLMTTVLSWDVVKGGLAFVLGLGIALYAVNKIRQGFGV